MRGAKKRKRGVEKDKKGQKLKSSFIYVVRIITDVYMQYTGEFALVLDDNKTDTQLMTQSA